MFKLPNRLPHLRNSAEDWADFAEFSSFRNSRISLLSLVRESSIISDESVVNGIDDDSDKYNIKADEISAEINHRIKILGNKYPFVLLDKDYSIEHNDKDSIYYWVYKFLLFSTRLSMRDNKMQNGLDGTFLFEELSAEVALNFFGDKAEVDIMGTSKSNVGGFRAKLSEVAKRMNEGGNIHKNEGHKPQDDNVDLIIWKGFSDKRSSQMIAFGQCKTGTSWQDRLSELNTRAFCSTWFSKQPVLVPVNMFFCAQYFPKEIWLVRAYEAGLVFDRFRILDYLPQHLSDNLYAKLKKWCLGAEQTSSNF